MKLTAEDLRLIPLALAAYVEAKQAEEAEARAAGDKLRAGAAAGAYARASALRGKIKAEERRRDTEAAKHADVVRAGPVN